MGGGGRWIGVGKSKGERKKREGKKRKNGKGEKGRERNREGIVTRGKK